jgi:D-amino-acid dehydrogenase
MERDFLRSRHLVWSSAFIIYNSAMGKKVIVLGAGVIGLSCAYACAQRGHQVVIVDRQPAEREGCSFGNAGMVVPSHFIPLAAPGMVALGLRWMWNPESPFYVKPRLDWGLISWGLKFWQAATPARVKAASPILRDYHLLSRLGYESLAASGHDFGLVRKGLLMLCQTQHALDEEAQTAALARSLGVPADVHDAAATAALDPAATMAVQGSVHFPLDCHLSPERYVRMLESALVQHGAEFHWSAEVAGFRTNEAGIQAVKLRHPTEAGSCDTALAEITGDEFILCGGAWSEAMGRQLGLRLPMQAGKGYSLTLPSPPQLPELCSILTEARVAVTPMGSSLRVGGTMEISGLSESISPARVRGIVRAMPRYFPAFKESHFEGMPPWRGLRPCSPDGLPFLGRTRAQKNLLVATAHSMMGLSLAPATGQLIAEVLSGDKPSVRLDLLSPDRYA